MCSAGKLHRQIVQMQVSEGIALKKLEDAAKKLTKMEAQLLRTEHKLDEKDETIYHNRLECCNKSKHLKHTIHVSGCLSSCWQSHGGRQSGFLSHIDTSIL